MMQKQVKLLKNVIGVGGFPGVGKSTLVNEFIKIGFIGCFEFDQDSENDILTILLRNYFVERYDAYLVQIGFINNAISRYKKAIVKAKNNEPVFIDRTIIENAYFAKSQIKDEFLLELYNYEHQKKYNEMLYKIGLPSLYFHLTTTFDDAMARWKTRDKDEYDEKMKNIGNFKSIFKFYKNNFEKDLKSLNIECFTIDTSKKNALAVRDSCMKILKDKGIIK